MLSLGLGSGDRRIGSEQAAATARRSLERRQSENTTSQTTSNISVNPQRALNLRHAESEAGSKPPTPTSSLRARSRSPSGSPLFSRRSTASGVGRIDSPSQLYTIPSASDIHGSNLEAFNDSIKEASSPVTSAGLYMNGGQDSSSKTRALSLASTSSAPRNIPGDGVSDPIGTGSPRESSRLYERGGTSVSSSYGAGTNTSLFSSSFPSSGGIWSNDPKPNNPNSSMPPPTGANPVRTSLSRHLSLSGTIPKPVLGGTGLVSSPSRAGSGPTWPDSPLSVEEVALSSSNDYRQGRPRTRMFGNSTSGSGGNTPALPSPYLQADQINAGSSTSNFPRSLSINSDRIVSSVTGPGIAISNMSPFVRDARGLPSVAIPPLQHAGRGNGSGPASAHPYASSFTTSQDFLRRGPITSTGESFGSASGFPSGLDRAMPANHGAVGSGRTASMAAPVTRNRTQSIWGSERPLREGDEDAFYDAEDDEDDYAPPTRSGATSRRHSVAAFTSTSTLTALTSPPAMRSQMGFNLPSETSAHISRKQDRASTAADAAARDRNSTSAHFTIGSSSRLEDEDLLATDLSNALHINLQAQAVKQQREGDEDAMDRLRRLGGYDSRASSMPAQPGAHFSQADNQLSSPFGSLQVSMPGGQESTSPPRSRRPGHDRRSSTSGDPYSPSASAARFLATAHHVQPPAIRPQSGASPILPRSNPPRLQVSPGPDAGYWPPQGANVFAQHQQSSSFRGGTLPAPDQLPAYNQQMYGQGQSSQSGFPLPSSYDFISGTTDTTGRGPSPSTNQYMLRQMRQTVSPPPPGSFLPPFAGFPAAHRMSGLPPPALSPTHGIGQPYFVPPIAPQPNVNDLGRGVPLHALPSTGPLYIVEFKAGRTDLFYVEDSQNLVLQKSDLVVVEADRGKDLGKILTSCTLEEVRDFQMHQVESALGQLAAKAGGGATIGGIGTLPPDQQPSAAAIARMTKEIHPKKIYGLASPADVALLAVKASDENKALNVCRAKVMQHQLPMEVTDAEFQFDRRRLTFFYIADRRIDFRNLVKDLFRLYKTRIWLCAIDNGVIQRGNDDMNVTQGAASSFTQMEVPQPWM